MLFVDEIAEEYREDALAEELRADPEYGTGVDDIIAFSKRNGIHSANFWLMWKATKQNYLPI